MNLIIDYQAHFLIKRIIEKEFGKLNIRYKVQNSSQLEILEDLPSPNLNNLKVALKEYGIEIKETQQDHFIQNVKDIVNEIIYHDDCLSIKTSQYLSEKLNMSYGYISTIFSESTHSTLENFIILKKIERAKRLILSDAYTLTEIAYMLNYSSVCHLSAQFKKITGLTSSLFVKIIKRRNRLMENSVNN